jgi:hypothetical protein
MAAKYKSRLEENYGYSVFLSFILRYACIIKGSENFRLKWRRGALMSHGLYLEGVQLALEGKSGLLGYSTYVRDDQPGGIYMNRYRRS